MKQKLCRGAGAVRLLAALLVLGSGAVGGCSGSEGDCGDSRTCSPPDPSDPGGAGGSAGAFDGVGGSSGAGPIDPPSTGIGGGAGAENAGAGGAEPAEDRTAPFIESIEPADASVGVRADAPIVIRFSEPMDRAIAEAAIASPEIAEPAFSWDETGRVLTITPGTPLEYASGSDPSAVMPRSYTLTVSRGATDLAGNRLAEAGVTTFSTLRRLSWAAEQVRIGSALVAAVTDSGGAIPCVAYEIPVGEIGEGGYTKLFTSFGLSGLPPRIAEFENATLTTNELLGVAGVPYGERSLGVLQCEHVRFTTLGTTALSTPGLGEPHVLADALSAKGKLTTDLAADLSRAYAAGDAALQLRIGFSNTVSDNGQNDRARFSCINSFALDVTYLVP